MFLKKNLNLYFLKNGMRSLFEKIRYVVVFIGKSSEASPVASLYGLSPYPIIFAYFRRRFSILKFF
jgi:hypothetical protein